MKANPPGANKRPVIGRPLNGPACDLFVDADTCGHSNYYYERIADCHKPFVHFAKHQKCFSEQPGCAISQQTCDIRIGSDSLPSMENRKDYVASLARGIEIIRAFTAPQGEGRSTLSHRIGPTDALTLSQVAERVGVARAVARRFLLTLADLGYVATDGKYFRLTARVLDLGYAYLSSMPLSRIATEFLEEVTEQTKESSSASVLNGRDIIYVARVPTRHILSITLSIGTRLPAYCTSMGRVLLAALPKPELQRYLEEVQLRPRTPNTVTDKKRFREILNEVLAEGYALTSGELEEGLRSIAVPVRSSSGRTIAAINISTQVARVTKAQMLKEFLPILRTTAQRLGAALPA